MSDLKSKLPDINELGKMAGKLFADVKNSVTEIVSDYKKNHVEPAADIKAAAAETKAAAAETKAAAAETKAAVAEEKAADAEKKAE